MPELPEVETIRRQLSSALRGKVFSSIEVRLAKQIKGLSVTEFRDKLVGSKVMGTDRRAKMLIIKIALLQSVLWKVGSGGPLDQRGTPSPDSRREPPDAALGSIPEPSQRKSAAFLVFHLKMSGQLICQLSNVKGQMFLKGGGHPIKGSLEHLPNKYSHVIFTFKDGSKLFFNDTRQFGWVTLVDSYKLKDLSKGFGPEPLSAEFQLQKFTACMKARPKLNIYKALLDQKCVVGIGNIYANESLFRVGIKPTRKSKNVTAREYKKLFNAIKRILKLAISKRGTTIDKYMDALGDFGNFSKYLKVYQQDGKPCTRRGCQGMIKRLKIAGRSAFYCPSCQK